MKSDGLIRDPLLKICMTIQVATIASWWVGGEPNVLHINPQKADSLIIKLAIIMYPPWN